MPSILKRIQIAFTCLAVSCLLHKDDLSNFWHSSYEDMTEVGEGCCFRHSWVKNSQLNIGLLSSHFNLCWATDFLVIFIARHKAPIVFYREEEIKSLCFPHFAITPCCVEERCFLLLNFSDSKKILLMKFLSLAKSPVAQLWQVQTSLWK